MIWGKLIFGGIGRRGLEAIFAWLVLVAAVAVIASSLMVVEGARDALSRAERIDRPDIIQVKSRFNRALFETPQTGNLAPLTLPVYEPLIDPENLAASDAIDGIVVARQSLFRNIVSNDQFLNIYVFGIDPEMEREVSKFSIARGRFLRNDDDAAAVLDQASARALGVDLGDTFQVRKADGEDLTLTVIGILDGLALRDPPPRTVEAPALASNSSFVSSGAFVTLRTSEKIFGRPTLTDALVVVRTLDRVPLLVDRLREIFRLEPGVFVAERYTQFHRKVQDFTLTLGLFGLLGLATALLAGSFVANLLHDVYVDRRHQYAILMGLGCSPTWSLLPAVAFGLILAVSGSLTGWLLAVVFGPRDFAMPSLMSDLGSVVPKFDVFVAGASLAVGTLRSRSAWRRQYGNCFGTPWQQRWHLKLNERYSSRHGAIGYKDLSQRGRESPASGVLFRSTGRIRPHHRPVRLRKDHTPQSPRWSRPSRFGGDRRRWNRPDSPLTCACRGLP